MVKTGHFHCCGPDPIPGGGTKILQAARWGQNPLRIGLSNVKVTGDLDKKQS